MKTFYYVGIAALMITWVSMVCRETVAQHSHAGHASQGVTQPNAVANHSPQDSAVSDEEAAEIRANLAKLSEEDQQLAVAQGFCAIMVKNRLGLMGPPIKVMVKDQPVFLCCA